MYFIELNTEVIVPTLAKLSQGNTIGSMCAVHQVAKLPCMQNLLSTDSINSHIYSVDITLLTYSYVFLRLWTFKEVSVDNCLVGKLHNHSQLIAPIEECIQCGQPLRSSRLCPVPKYQLQTRPKQVELPFAL